MDKIYVVYWSQSGNTKAMADSIGKGIMNAGREACGAKVMDREGLICQGAPDACRHQKCKSF